MTKIDTENPELHAGLEFLTALGQRGKRYLFLEDRHHPLLKQMSELHQLHEFLKSEGLGDYSQCLTPEDTAARFLVNRTNLLYPSAAKELAGELLISTLGWILLLLFLPLITIALFFFDRRKGRFSIVECLAAILTIALCLSWTCVISPRFVDDLQTDTQQAAWLILLALIFGAILSYRFQRIFWLAFTVTIALEFQIIRWVYLWLR